MKYSLAEIAKHKSSTSCWVAIHEKVYDVTDFLMKHPGGTDILLDVAGTDGSQIFEEIGRHSSRARELMEVYYIGDVDSISQAISVGSQQ